jgi:fatty-acyl-CoA synthase
MMAGAIPYLLPSIAARQDPALFWQAQLAVLERARTRLILTDAATMATLQANAPHLSASVLDIDVPQAPRAGTALPPARSVALLQHSSGTTGAKKGVMLTHTQVIDFVNALGAALGVTQGDIIASWLPLYHDMGLIGCLMLPMLLGLTTVHMDPFSWVNRPAALLEMITRHRATICWQPNFAFQHLMRAAPRHGDWDLSSMRAFIDCSEPCKPDTLRAFRDRFAGFGLRPEAVQVSYGMAENVFIATQTVVGKIPRVIETGLAAFDAGRIEPPGDEPQSLAFVSTGPAIPGTQVRILDDGGKPLAERLVGQIAVTSPYLFTGYHGSELAQERLIDGWYSSGDFGFMDGGEVFVCGRRDELLIINGRNIYANDLEFAVNRATAVKPGRCVALGPYNPRTASASLVVIAETEETAPEARELLARAVQEVVLGTFGIMANDVKVTDVGWLLKTTSGKIARGGNERKYLQERQTMTPPVKAARA